MVFSLPLMVFVSGESLQGVLFFFAPLLRLKLGCHPPLPLTMYLVFRPPLLPSFSFLECVFSLDRTPDAMVLVPFLSLFPQSPLLIFPRPPTPKSLPFFCSQLLILDPMRLVSPKYQSMSLLFYPST